MADPNVTKTCCGGHYPLGELFCVECKEALEGTHYRFWILATSLTAAAIEWVLAHSGVLHEFIWVEALMLEPLLLVLFYPVAKGVQKIREPSRPVLREMGSVFADRWSRFLIVAAWVLIALGWTRHLPGLVPTARNLVDPADVPIRHALVITSGISFTVVSLLVLFDQGLRMFDPRIANTYAARGRG